MASLREFIVQKINDYEALLHVTNGRCKQQFYAGMIKACTEILEEIDDVD